ncbi:MAG: UbiA prenyltransferase family protein [Candidatus Micrarchaeales archaeon]
MANKIKLVFNELFIGMILLVVVPTALLGVVASGDIIIASVLAGGILITLLQIAPNVLNNYADWEIDEKNRKRADMHKVIKRGALPVMALVLLVLTIPFFVYGNLYLKITMVIAYFLILNYNFLIKAKDILFLNYAFIALGYGPVAFAIGFFVSSANLATFEQFLWVPAFIFLVNMGFVIIKDYGDIEGDKALGKITLPIAVGKRLAIFYQAILITAVFAVMIYLGLTSIRWPLSVLLVVPYLIAAYAIKMISAPKNRNAYSTASNLIRLNALIVMLILFSYFA